MKKKKQKLLGGILPLLILGAIWNGYYVQQEKINYKPVGEFVELDAYRMHYYSKGQGDQVFCLIQGSGTPCAYTDFYLLQEALSSLGQTVSFDHAGGGWSECTKAPRDIGHLVSELDELLEAVAPCKEVILVCHSLGSLEAIGYAQKHPEKVKGIIFLDSGSPEFYSMDSELTAKLLNRGTAFIRFIGLNRLLGDMGIALPLYGQHIRNAALPNETLKHLDMTMYNRFTGNPNTLISLELMNENAESVLKGERLGDLPILVLSSDSGRKWGGVQAELANWSQNSRAVTLTGASHYLYWSNTEAVIEEIVSFTEKELD